MLLFIKDIPRYSTKKEITRFISSARGTLGRFIPFISSYSLEKCQILRLEDKRHDTVEYHGLVSIASEKSCISLIDRLNGAIFFGKKVEVRPFIKRSPYKDRRRRYADLELLPVERRQQDRRRPFMNTRWLKCRNA